MYELTDLDYTVERVSFDLEKVDEARDYLASVLPASLASLSIPQLEVGEIRSSQELCADLNFAKIGAVTKDASVEAVRRAEVNVRREVAQDPDWLKSWRYPQYKHEMCKRLPGNISGALLQKTVSESLIDAGYPLDSVNEQRARMGMSIGAAMGGVLVASAVTLTLGVESPALTIFSDATGFVVGTSVFNRFTKGTRYADRSGIERVYRQQLKNPGLPSKLHGAVQATPSFAPHDPFYVESHKA